MENLELLGLSNPPSQEESPVLSLVVGTGGSIKKEIEREKDPNECVELDVSSEGILELVDEMQQRFLFQITGEGKWHGCGYCNNLRVDNYSFDAVSQTPREPSLPYTLFVPARKHADSKTYLQELQKFKFALTIKHPNVISPLHLIDCRGNEVVACPVCDEEEKRTHADKHFFVEYLDHRKVETAEDISAVLSVIISMVETYRYLKSEQGVGFKHCIQQFCENDEFRIIPEILRSFSDFDLDFQFEHVINMFKLCVGHLEERIPTDEKFSHVIDALYNLVQKKYIYSSFEETHFKESFDTLLDDLKKTKKLLENQSDIPCTTYRSFIIDGVDIGRFSSDPSYKNLRSNLHQEQLETSHKDRYLVDYGVCVPEYTIDMVWEAILQKWRPFDKFIDKRNVVSIGFGSNLHELYKLTEFCPNAQQILGIEWHAPYVMNAAKYLWRYKKDTDRDNIYLRQGDASQMSYISNQSVRLLWAGGIFNDLAISSKLKGKIIQEICRVMAEDGIIVTPNHDLGYKEFRDNVGGGFKQYGWENFPLKDNVDAVWKFNPKAKTIRK